MLNDKMLVSTILFWMFVVCELVAIAMFHGKVPSEINSSNVCGFVVGIIGVVSIIASRFVAMSAIRESVSDDTGSTR